jgi:hypothetical protein
MATEQSWPLDTTDHLAGALREQAQTPAEAERATDDAALLMQLATWRAPEPTGAETQRLLAALVPHLPAPAMATQSAAQPEQSEHGIAVEHWRAAWRLWQIIWRQPRVIHRAVWIAATLGILGSAAYTLALHDPVRSAAALAALLSLIVPASTAFIYGPEVDAGLELAQATPVSQRFVLLGRIGLLLGYQLALSLGATLLSVMIHGGNPWMVAALWFGPMALLSSGSLLLSLAFGPLVALVSTLAVWVAQVVQFDQNFVPHLLIAPLWQTSPVTLALAAALLVAALLYAPRRERRMVTGG